MDNNKQHSIKVLAGKVDRIFFTRSVGAHGGDDVFVCFEGCGLGANNAIIRELKALGLRGEQCKWHVMSNVVKKLVRVPYLPQNRELVDSVRNDIFAVKHAETAAAERAKQNRQERNGNNIVSWVKTVLGRQRG